MTPYRDLPEEERDLLAAEHALGLLEGEERAAAQLYAAEEEDFRARIGGWSGRLAPLVDEAEPREPPGELWSRIEARIAPPVRTDNVVYLRRKVAVWRGFSAGATAIAASLALVLLTRPDSAPPQAQPQAQPQAAAPMVAMIGSEKEEARLVATYDPDGGTLLVAPAVLASAAGHEHELWLIMPGDAPKPMGIVRPGQPLRMKVEPEMMRRMGPDATLAVSVEPVGGSPTGQPTGPVIASGKFAST